MSVPREVLYAADVAVRANLAAAGRLVRHKRGRANRALTPRCASDVFYLHASPPITAHEVDVVAQTSPTWWAPLRDTLAVFADGQPADRIVTACDEYLRALLASGQPHSLFDLRSYLEQAYAVTAAE